MSTTFYSFKTAAGEPMSDEFELKVSGRRNVRLDGTFDLLCFSRWLELQRCGNADSSKLANPSPLRLNSVPRIGRRSDTVFVSRQKLVGRTRSDSITPASPTLGISHPTPGLCARLCLIHVLPHGGCLGYIRVPRPMEAPSFGKALSEPTPPTPTALRCPKQSDKTKRRVRGGSAQKIVQSKWR